jgi:GrpB-like predicted nucleotidyltransferase (UPF0157 family)
MSDPSIDRRAVEIVPYDPAWPGVAAAEAARLAEALGATAVVIHHIGSTSVPGLSAKPTIDLMPLVTDLDAVDAARPRVEALGYQWRGEFFLPGRRYCPKDDAAGNRLFNVHIYRQDNPGVPRHLAFRDYLRAHPTEAAAYEAEKRRAAALHPDDTLAYNAEKNDWIQACEARALAWWRPER